MRERLAELIKKGIDKHESTIENYVHPEWEFIADYLIENGVVVLPFKVGDKVFRATQLVNGESFVQEGIVFEIASTYENEKSKTRFYFLAKGDEWESRHYSLWCDLTEFGKTVFLTRKKQKGR